MTPKEPERLKTMEWQPLRWQEEERFPAPQKLIIMSAGPGAMISREQNPYLPITPQEIVKNHVDACRAGASIVHVHVRDKQGYPVADLELFKRVILEIKDQCPDIIIDFGFSQPLAHDTVQARLEPIANLGLPIDIGTISGGSINVIGQDVYINRENYLESAVKYLREKKIKPVIGVYNVKHIEDVKRWAVKSGLIKRPFFDVNLGLFGDPARSDILQTLLRYLPEECDWLGDPAGRNWLPITVEAILKGGHVRAGMENGIYMYPHRDDLIKSSAEAVNKVRNISEELGREIATPKEAREILGLER